MGTSPRCANKWVNHSYLYIKHIKEKERLHKLPTRRRCKPCGKHCSNRYTQDMIGILLYDRGDTNHLEGNSIFFRPVTTISGKQGEKENPAKD